METISVSTTGQDTMDEFDEHPKIVVDGLHPRLEFIRTLFGESDGDGGGVDGHGRKMTEDDLTRVWKIFCRKQDVDTPVSRTLQEHFCFWLRNAHGAGDEGTGISILTEYFELEYPY